MRTYYRALPQATKGAPDVFDWVPNIKDATEDYRESAEATKKKLKKDNIDTALVGVQDDKLMETKYALAREVDVDPTRIKNQSIEPGKGITTRTDEVLTNPKPGETTFEGVHEVLDSDEK